MLTSYSKLHKKYMICEGAQKNDSEVADALSEKIALKVTYFI